MQQATQQLLDKDYFNGNYKSYNALIVNHPASYLGKNKIHEIAAKSLICCFCTQITLYLRRISKQWPKSEDAWEGGVAADGRAGGNDADAVQPVRNHLNLEVERRTGQNSSAIFRHYRARNV